MFKGVYIKWWRDCFWGLRHSPEFRYSNYIKTLKRRNVKALSHPVLPEFRKRITFGKMHLCWQEQHADEDECVERWWNDTDGGKLKHSENNLSQC
jgi:hypothetical protein